VFYRQLLKLCNEQNIKITPLIKSLDISQGNISRWKQGGMPSVEVLEKIASTLNVSTDYLLGKTDEKNSPSIGAVAEKFKEFVDILSVLPEDEQAEALKYIRYLRSQVSLQKSPEIK
jgi:transcriptional regulator with XRE-family HTH domain